MGLKIGGVVVAGPAEEVLVLPRPLTGDIVIKARAVLDMSLFDALCPAPKPPAILRRGNTQHEGNFEDAGYLALLDKHSQMRFAFICVQSLKPSEIEWQTVKDDSPSSWKNWITEMAEAGVSSLEIQRIVNCVLQANSLDDSKLKEARELFLLGMKQGSNTSSGHQDAQENTSSGSPANDGK